jgi:hypothetical protein
LLITIQYENHIKGAQMESTKVTPRPAMVDAGVSLVLQVAKQKLQEVHEVCKDLAGITTQFLIP